MKNTDLRAKARAIFGPAFAEPMPNQPNGAKALQQRANARPIPTYKVGGPVKKPMPTPADLAAAKAQNEMIKKATVSKEDAARFAAGNRASEKEGAEMRKMKMKTGGKVQTPADLAAAKAQNELIKEMMANGGAKTSSDAKRYIARMQEVDRKAEEIKARGPHNAYGTKEARDKVLRKVQNDIEARDRADEDAVKRKPVGVDFIYGEPATYRKMSKMEKMAYDDQAKRSGYNEEGSFGRKHLVSGVKKTEVFPDARKRGIKPADVMKNGGKVQTSSDTARKLATEMGGYKKGGKVKPKDGLAVMIAIGKPMKPAKKMNGGAMAAGSKDMEASKVTRAMAMGGDPMGYAAGGAGKTRKGQAPIKKAQGGAAKVRKGMMTPEGNIIDVMNKMRGK
jgi:hypothetical protein